MRRTLLCCALLTVVLGGCASSGASPTSYNGQPPADHRYPTYAPAPSAAASVPSQYQPPQPTWQPYATAAPSWGPYETPYPERTPAGTPYDTTTFDGVGTSPYIDAARDPVSTFGLDVDTASYTIAQRFVRDGNRPDPSSIRVEEWVNYFNQGYAPPDDTAFAIHADGGPTPFLSQQELLLRVGVKAHDVSRRTRPSAALTFVIDVSGSMDREDRLELVKQSLRLLVAQLRPDDRVAIVVFGSSARVALPSVPGSAREQILSVINGLHPEDSTNAEAGLRLGYDLARQQRNGDGVNRVILATDGVANVGNVDAATILRNAGAQKGSGIQLVAVGVGMGNFNDVLLEQLADEGDGYYAYVDTLEEARRIFVDELTTTIETVAIDAKAQVEFDPALVAAYRQIGYENRALPDNQFRNPNAEGGTIGAGHEVTVLYAVVLRHTGVPSDHLATVNLRWTDPEGQRSREIAEDIESSDLSGSWSGTCPNFKLDALVAATAEVLHGSPWIKDYPMRSVNEVAHEISGQLPHDPDVAEFLQLLDRVAQL